MVCEEYHWDGQESDVYSRRAQSFRGFRLRVREQLYHRRCGFRGLSKQLLLLQQRWLLLRRSYGLNTRPQHLQVFSRLLLPQLSTNAFAMYWFMTSADCAKCGRCAGRAPGTSPAQGCGNDVDEDGHGSHCAGSSSLQTLPQGSLSNAPYLRAGTIAGSSSHDPTTPPSFRNNGVAGAKVSGASARGAMLYVQVGVFVWGALYLKCGVDVFPGF